MRDRRRGQIIAAARQLIARGGVEALTFSALEERCGLSRGVLTYHFDHKQEIVLAVLDSARREIGEATVARLDPVKEHPERLRVALRSTVEGFLAHGEAATILLSFLGQLQADPQAARINAELYARYRAEVGALLEAGIRARAFRKVDVPATAGWLVGLVLGVVTQHALAPRAFDPLAAIELAAEGAVARLARGTGRR